MTIRQVDLARELATSEMTVSRLLRGLYRDGQELTELDCIRVFAIVELQRHGLSRSAALELVNELASEFRYVDQHSENRCWAVMIKNGNQSFPMPAVAPAHLDSLLSVRPMSRVIALHHIASQASERLASLKAAKEAANA
ncbi:hypothetical protein [Agrobacterium salinitolerans]|uniref:hypothetical protein n=1 Tax=Agrobacterium salinitolerans TaxID=1183413 RepID=UPI0022B8483D|nr:hypothetical protein [Agrobacterium salinitolerans]MCZ7888083.1 hypothetical protein [Agrobacterium salinitolerans]